MSQISTPRRYNSGSITVSEFNDVHDTVNANDLEVQAIAADVATIGTDASPRLDFLEKNLALNTTR